MAQREYSREARGQPERAGKWDLTLEGGIKKKAARGEFAAGCLSD